MPYSSIATTSINPSCTRLLNAARSSSLNFQTIALAFDSDCSRATLQPCQQRAYGRLRSEPLRAAGRARRPALRVPRWLAVRHFRPSHRGRLRRRPLRRHWPRGRGPVPGRWPLRHRWPVLVPRWPRRSPAPGLRAGSSAVMTSLTCYAGMAPAQLQQAAYRLFFGHAQLVHDDAFAPPACPDRGSARPGTF